MRSFWLALWMIGGLSTGAPARGAANAGETMRLKGHGDAVFCVAISPDGTRIVSGSNDKTAIIWDAAKGKSLQRFEGHAECLTAVGFSGDGKRVVTGSLDHTARVWETESGALVGILKGEHVAHVHGAAISPDGQRVLTASCDGSIVLWDVAGERLLERYSQQEECDGVAFSPDGRTFKGHNGHVRQIAFEPDGQWLWTGAEADALRVWDRKSGEIVGTFKVSAPFGAFRLVHGRRQFVWFSRDQFHERSLEK